MKDIFDEEFKSPVVDSILEPFSGYNRDKDFTTLKAWKDAREAKSFFYKKVIPLLPASEKYNLYTQIRKASISTTANIAEGYGRFYYTEGIQFYRISRASMYELKDHLISCLDIGYIKEDDYNKGLNLIETTKVSINGYINYVKQRMNEK